MPENLKVTSYKYDSERYWIFKNLVTSQKKSINQVMKFLLDRYIEDHNDYLNIYDILKKGEQVKKNKIVTWDEFKRRTNLDV